jgi:hypothetical protein
MKYCARTDQAESEQNCSLQAIIGVANIEAALAAVMSRPQRMVRRNPRLQTSITEETFRSLILAAPPLSTGGLNAPTHLSTESYPHVKITTLNSVFQQPASETQLAAQSVQGVTVMVVKTEEIVCRFMGDFKVGDNLVRNATALCRLDPTNEAGIFNKLMIVQAGSITEAAPQQILYRAAFQSRGRRQRLGGRSACDCRKKTRSLPSFVDVIEKYNAPDRHPAPRVNSGAAGSIPSAGIWPLIGHTGGRSSGARPAMLRDQTPAAGTTTSAASSDLRPRTRPRNRI